MYSTLACFLSFVQLRFFCHFKIGLAHVLPLVPLVQRVDAAIQLSSVRWRIQRLYHSFYLFGILKPFAAHRA